MKATLSYALIGLLLSAAASSTIAPASPAQAAYPPSLLSGTSHPPAGKVAPNAAPITAYASKAPIALSWRLAERPQLGQPVAITLDFRALTGLTGEVRLIGEQGLQVQSADFSIAHRARDAHWTTQVLVTPTLASRRYLNVVVSTTDDAGQHRMRGFAVPVVVDPGAVRAKRQGPVATDASGVAVVSMPARQEISRTP